MGALKLNNKNEQVKDNKLKQCLNKETIKMNKAHYVEEAEKFIELIHKNNTGYMAFLQKENEIATQYMVEDITYNQLHNITHFKDLYISINSFYIPKRTTECVRQINAFWVDLDYYKIPKYAKKTPEQMIKILRKKKLFKKIEPSFFVGSGGGLYIFYLIKDMPKQMSGIWSKVELAIAEKFKNFGADMGATDISRVLRLPGTINTKNGNVARIIYNSKSQYSWENPIESIKRYSFKEIQKIYLPSKEFKPNKSNNKVTELKSNQKEVIKQKNKTTNGKVTTLFTLRNLHYNRILDIESIVKYRKGIMKECRHHTLYIYMITNLHFDGDIEHAIVKTKELNNMLAYPMIDDEEQEFIDIINTAIKAYKKFVEASKEYTIDKGSFVYYIRNTAKCVLYSNIGIINRLDITSEEMEKLKLKTLINEDEKKRRKRDYKKEKYHEKLKAEGKLTKKEQLEEVYCKIKNLRKEGFKNKQIAEVLNLPVKTLERHITYLKKEGLL
ncbi:hypothetical protein I6A86_17885 [Clostridioides difficile]|nr:hypothetical protein [Clostridioides difficile]MBZ0937823.1 hypothetical protein [Clostridioides difficile]